MTNPVLVEVTRGNQVESRHRGSVVVVDGDGATVFALGDVEASTFPRSACKAMQALPLVESGAADAYGFGDREIALACASHSGEPEHVALAERMLNAAGQGELVLECGAHWSFQQGVLLDQARSLDRPSQLHNNCSGKHAGFICACCHSGHDVSGYVGYDHPIQAEIRDVMADLTGTVPSRDTAGVDGCSIPTYSMPLRALAHGFARMASGAGLGAGRARASKRIMDSCMAEPFYVAGTGRACTRLMQVAPGRVFVKTGAEGVFCAAIPERGLGIAVKCDDGTARAADSIVAAVLARFFEGEVKAGMQAIADHTMRNWNGIEVGAVRVSEYVAA
ncbi:MAG: asparaginase [Rhizobium sp.]|nr:asparaginase [Rhizobium sp.]